MTGSKPDRRHEILGQVLLNREQVVLLEDLLVLERAKFLTLTSCGTVFACFLLAIVVAAFVSQNNLTWERFATPINVAGVFCVFALFEIFSAISDSNVLLRRIRKLLNEHATALLVAAQEYPFLDEVVDWRR